MMATREKEWKLVGEFTYYFIVMFKENANIPKQA